MIEIKKCDSLSGLEDFGFDLYPGSVIMSAKDKDEILGAGQVLVRDNYALLTRISVRDEYKGFNLEHSIAKSLLNMVDLGGIGYVFSDMEDENLIKSLRFEPNIDKAIPDLPKIVSRYKYFLNLEGYFTLHC